MKGDKFGCLNEMPLNTQDRLAKINLISNSMLSEFEERKKLLQTLNIGPVKPNIEKAMELIASSTFIKGDEQQILLLLATAIEQLDELSSVKRKCSVIGKSEKAFQSVAELSNDNLP